MTIFVVKQTLFVELNGMRNYAMTVWAGQIYSPFYAATKLPVMIIFEHQLHPKFITL